MTKLIKMLLREAEEHKAFDLEYHAYSARDPEEPVSAIHRSMNNTLELRLTKLPHTVKLKLPGEDTSYEKRFAIKHELAEKMLRLKRKDQAAYDTFKDEVFSRLREFDTVKELSSELNEELSELIEHLVTILKAKMVTLAHELEERETAYLARAKAELEAKLDRLLEN